MIETGRVTELRTRLISKAYSRLIEDSPQFCTSTSDLSIDIASCIIDQYVYIRSYLSLGLYFVSLYLRIVRWERM